MCVRCHSLDPVGTRPYAHRLTPTPVVPTCNVLLTVIAQRMTPLCLQLKIICRRRTILGLVREVQCTARELTERCDSLCRCWPWLMPGRNRYSCPTTYIKRLQAHKTYIQLIAILQETTIWRAPLQKLPVNIPRGNNKPTTKRRTVTANGSQSVRWQGLRRNPNGLYFQIMSYSTHVKCNYVLNDCHRHQHTPARKFRLKNYIVLKKNPTVPAMLQSWRPDAVSTYVK